jgi:hypothetical protein
LAANSTDISWTYALCNGDPSPLLVSSWSTSLTTIDYIVLHTTDLDSNRTTFSTDTANLFATTSRLHKPYPSEKQSYSEIAETYVIPYGKLSNS